MPESPFARRRIVWPGFRITGKPPGAVPGDEILSALPLAVNRGASLADPGNLLLFSGSANSVR